MSAALGQQFFVEDKPGAGSNIASAEVAKAAPDGYTLTVVSTGFMVNMSLYAHVPYDAVKDFAPITMVAYSPNVIVVNPSVPAKSVKELIALIKANPGKYSFAGPGIGSTPHLSGELFKQKFGLEMVHVPYPGRGAGDHLDHRRPHADRLYGAATGAGQCAKRQIACARRARGQAQQGNPRRADHAGSRL